MSEINNTLLVQEVNQSKTTDSSIRTNTISILTEAENLKKQMEKKNTEFYKKFKREYDDIRNATIIALRLESANIKTELWNLKWELIFDENLSNWKINESEIGEIRNELNEFKIINEKSEIDINELNKEEAINLLKILNNNYKKYGKWSYTWLDENNIIELSDTKDVNVFQEKLIEKIISDWENDLLKWYNNEVWNYLINTNEIKEQINSWEIEKIDYFALKQFLSKTNWLTEIEKTNLIKYWGKNKDVESYKLANDLWLIESKDFIKIKKEEIKKFSDSAKIWIENYDNFFKEYILKGALNLKDYKDSLSYIKDKDILLQILDKVKWDENIEISLKNNINEKFYNDIDVIEKFWQNNWNLRILDLKVLDENFLRELYKNNFERLIKITNKEDIWHILINLKKSKINAFLKDSTLKDEIKSAISDFYNYKIDGNKVWYILTKISDKKITDITDIEFEIIDKYIWNHRDSLWDITILITENSKNLSYFSKLPRTLSYILEDNIIIKGILDKNLSFLMYLNKEQRKNEDVINIILDNLSQDEEKNKKIFNFLSYIELDSNNPNLILKIYRTLKKILLEEKAKDMLLNWKNRAKLLNFMDEIKEGKDLSISIEFKKEFEEISKIFSDFNDEINKKRAELENKIKENKTVIEKNKNQLNWIIEDNINIDWLDLWGNKELIKKSISDILNWNINSFWDILKILSKEKWTNKEKDEKINKIIDNILKELKKLKNKNSKEIKKTKLSEKDKEEYKEFLTPNWKNIDEEKIKNLYTIEIQKAKNIAEKEKKEFNEEEFKKKFLEKFKDLDKNLYSALEKSLNLETRKNKIISIQYNFNKNPNKTLDAYKNWNQKEIDKFWKDVDKTYYQNIETEALEIEKQEKLENSKIMNWKIIITNSNYLGTNNINITDRNWEKGSIKLTDEDKKLLEKNKDNPEVLSNLVDFYIVLKELWLNELWEHKENIFQAITNKKWASFDVKWDFLDERETIIFINSILESIWKQKIDSLNIETFKNTFKKQHIPELKNDKDTYDNASNDFTWYFKKLFIKSNIFQIDEFEKSLK